MSWHWPWERDPRLVPPEEDTGTERLDAATTRAHVEGARDQERERTAEVVRVAAESRRLRVRNNFSLRITESFRGHNGTSPG